MDVTPLANLDAAPTRHASASGRPTTPFGITLGHMLRLYAEPRPMSAPSAGSVAPARSPLPADPVRRPHAGSDLGLGPLARPLPGEVGSAWGPRRHPVHGDVRMHHGADIAAPTGTPVRAFAEGTVTFAGSRGGYGKVVIVEHADGVETRYAHQSGIDVVVGQRVIAGEVVGRVGATGTATGPHLHFELRRHGESIDPAAFLP